MEHFPTPPLGFGLGTTWFGGARGSEALTSCVHAALDAGFRHIDEAEMYGNEDVTGPAISSWLGRPGNAATRADLFITSKVLGTIEVAGAAARKAGGDTSAVAAAEVVAVGTACRASLVKLQLEYLDLFLLHAPFARSGVAFTASLPELWGAMEALVEEGLVRHVGVSNWREADLRAVLEQPAGVLRHRPACNQLEYHPLLQQPTLAAFSAAEGIATVSYAPLSPITKPACSGDGPGDVAAVAEAVAEELSAASSGGPCVTTAQVLLRWSLQTAQSVITTSTKVERIVESIAVLDGSIVLSAAQVARITDAGRPHWVRSFWGGSLGVSDPPHAIPIPAKS